jgi:hypothetical protein
MSHDWITGKTVRRVNLGFRDDERKACASYYYLGTKTGYMEHRVEFRRGKDGSLSLYHENDGFIYLYPEQVRQLKDFLKR